jgi:hypothetical protein
MDEPNDSESLLLAFGVNLDLRRYVEFPTPIAELAALDGKNPSSRLNHIVDGEVPTAKLRRIAGFGPKVSENSFKRPRDTATGGVACLHYLAFFVTAFKHRQDSLRELRHVMGFCV